MKKISLILLVLVIAGCTNTPPIQNESEEVVEPEISQPPEYVINPQYSINEFVYEEGEYKGYVGGYFFVSPPEDFKLLDTYNSNYAAFESPDGKVVFAIYAPQWFGEGTEIWPNEDIESETEREVKESIAETSEVGPNATRIDTYVTTVAHDGSFWRSLHEIILEKGSRTQRIFSYQYEDKEAYDKYLTDYKTFKESLEQYAD